MSFNQPTVAGVVVTMILVNVFPARRTRELLGLIGLGALLYWNGSPRRKFSTLVRAGVVPKADVFRKV